MNMKFFKKYKHAGQYNGYNATFAVISDGDIVADPEWQETEEILNPEWTWYQCYNPSVCIEDYMEKQRRVDELQGRVRELRAEQSVLKSLLGSKLPIDQPVVFGEIVAVMNEEGVVLFQKAILPTDL